MEKKRHSLVTSTFAHYDEFTVCVWHPNKQQSTKRPNPEIMVTLIQKHCTTGETERAEGSAVAARQQRALPYLSHMKKKIGLYY